MAAIVTLFIAGCTAPIKSGSDFDTSVDFSSYKTFTWMDGGPMIIAGGGPAQISPLSRERIRVAIADNLAARGLRMVEDTEPADLVIAFTVGTRDKIRATSYPSYYHGPWPWRGPYDTGVDVRTYTEGTLSIDIFDAHDKRPVWHGWARKVISQSDRDEPQPVIRAGVKAALTDFPPAAG